MAIYPKEGTLFSDDPFIILNASWVTDKQKAAAYYRSLARLTRNADGDRPELREAKQFFARK